MVVVLLGFQEELQGARKDFDQSFGTGLTTRLWVKANNRISFRGLKGDHCKKEEKNETNLSLVYLCFACFES